jgi:two-component system, NtrC family, sensor histidine kinase PilS
MVQLDSITDIKQWMTESHRRNLRLFSLYRLAMSFTLLFSQATILGGGLSTQQPALTLRLLLIYLIFSSISFALSWPKRPKFEISLPVQIIIDIGFIILMMHLFDQNQTGVGLLLVITIVFASLISEGRFALFYASIATIGILLEQTFNILIAQTANENYSYAVLLSTACFATAWLAYTLARRMQHSERLAAERGLDIINLAKINERITQEMPNGVLVINEKQQIKHFNQQFSVLTGLVHADIMLAMQLATPLSKFLPSLSSLYDNWSRLDYDSKQTQATKLTLSNRDLGIRFLSISNERNQGAIIFVEDWSQVQTQAHQVKLAALGRLTANIAHEIRNPLSAISHANQLLQEDSSDPATLRMLQIIADNVQRLDQIIKDVLELNRRDRTNQESIALNHFINDFYHQFCAVEKIHTTDFVVNLNADDAVVYFDRRHINQILWNLCKNGWRHCKKNAGSLSLSVTPQKNGPFICIEISDDGDGIAPQIQNNLFEPFITSEKTGTGLGLYIARELAEANGAKLDFKTGNTGTQFTLYVKKV